jgi:hypothetical protein
LARNFTSPVLYTVTAADSSTTKTYTVTGTVALNSAKDITSFSVPGQTGTAAINNTNNTVSFTVPYGTSLTSLAPTIAVSPGASISPASGTARNFSSAQTYTVTAANGSAKTYTVTGAVAKNTAKDITSFSVAGVNGVVGADTVTVTVPLFTDVSALSPTIVVSDRATVSPASGTAQDFSSPKTYTVRAENGSTKTYTVTVAVTTWTAANVSFSGYVQHTSKFFNGTISGNSFSAYFQHPSKSFTGTISGNSFSGYFQHSSKSFTGTISGNSFSGYFQHTSKHFTGTISDDSFSGYFQHTSRNFTGTISGGSRDDTKIVAMLTNIMLIILREEEYLPDLF